MDKPIDWFDREVRYRVKGDFWPATVLRTTESGDETVQAQLLDISQRGLKLSVPIELANDEVFRVRLANDELGVDVIESAQVCWARKQEETDSWTVGCKIQQQIDKNTLEDLVEHGLLDRRFSGRRPVTGDALAQWELSGESVPVQLLNLSAGGFCLASDQPTKIGSRLKLILSDDDGRSSGEILARARWQREFDNGYLIGCEMTLDDVLDLVGHFSSSPQVSFANPGRRRKLPLLASVALLSVVAVACIAWIIL